MRQIKFRGKNFETGQWVYGDLVQTCREAAIYYDDGECTYTPDVITDTVGQFTGILDCNGKEVYEGDILERYNEQGIIMHVNYFGSQFGCVQHWDGVSGEGSWYPLDNYDMSQWEVVGNIYDNPELLNGQ